MANLGGPWVQFCVVFVGAAVALGCGGDDPAAEKKDCGTPSNPDPFVIESLEPAIGASVPNGGIVHRLKVVGSLIPESIPLTLLPAHTAGSPTPALTFAITFESDGASYASPPVAWATAPGHVELE